MNKKKRKKSHIFDGGGNIYAPGQTPTNWSANTVGLDTTDPASYKGNSNGNSGSNFMSNATQIASFAGMFDSIAQAGTSGIDASRAGVSDQSREVVEGVLGGQTGSHLGNMFNTQAKTREALNYIREQGNANYDLNSTDGILLQYDNLGHLQHSNINTKGKELEDFVFDPISYGITRLTGMRKTAAERQNEINDAIDAANAQRDAAFLNANINYDKRRKANMMYNYFDFGGPMFGMPITGASSYDIAKDNALTKQMQAQSKNSTSFNPIFNAPTTFAAGGLLSNNFTNGVTIIGNGGTHERNPHEGVPMGIAPDGAPNLVEEGEAVFNDYVFSNRLRVPKAVRNKYKLRGPKNMTFAEAFIKAQKESEERENDPISQNGLENIAMILARTQEAIKGYNRAKGHKAAEGGHVFVRGGKYDLSNLFGDSSYAAANLAGYLPYDRKMTREEVSALEKTPKFQAWTDYVLNNWDNPEVQSYLKELDRRGGNNKLFDAEGNPIAGAQEYFKEARTTGPMGYYHWTPELLRYEQMPSEPLGLPIEAQKAPELMATSPITVNPASTSPLNMAEINLNGIDTSNPASYINNGNSGKIDNGRGNDGSGKATLGDLSKLRYADILANATAVGTDLLGITNTPTVFDEIGPFQPITFNPIGNYIPVTHFDTNYEGNQEAQQAAAARGAIMQSTAPARWANLLAADYNAQMTHGDLMRAAAMQDYERGVQRETFNRGTDQYNSEGALKAAMANQDAKLKYNQQALMQARLNDEASTMASAAKAANFGNLAESISNLGREKDYRNWVKYLADAGVFGTMAAKGGKIRKRKKGLTY